MPGLEQMVEDFKEIEVHGRMLKFTELTLRDYSKATARVRKDWATPQKAAEQVLSMTLNPVDREAVLKQAYLDEKRGNPVEVADVERWFSTPDGFLFKWWLRLQRYQPEMTEEDVSTQMAEILPQLAQLEAGADPTIGGV